MSLTWPLLLQGVKDHVPRYQKQLRLQQEMLNHQQRQLEFWHWRPLGLKSFKSQPSVRTSTTRSSREKLDPLTLKKMQDFMVLHFRTSRSYGNGLFGNKILESHRERRMDVRKGASL